jgi:hypothetical protein
VREGVEKLNYILDQMQNRTKREMGCHCAEKGESNNENHPHFLWFMASVMFTLEQIHSPCKTRRRQRGKPAGKIIGALHLNQPMSFCISKSTASFEKRNSQNSLDLFHTNQYMLPPPLNMSVGRKQDNGG